MTRRLAEVAARAGVSEATVSRVLNSKPGVSDATRRRVLTALDVLGYERPTKLRGERARLVGLVLPELQNPIFPALAEVVGALPRPERADPGALHPDRPAAPRRPDYVDLLLEQQQVAGIIFAGGQYSQADADHAHYDRLARRKLPVVLINAGIDRLPFPRVVCDDAQRDRAGAGPPALAGPRADRPRARPARPPARRCASSRPPGVCAAAGLRSTSARRAQPVLAAERPGVGRPR